jgi:hypothetical protein
VSQSGTNVQDLLVNLGRRKRETKRKDEHEEEREKRKRKRKRNLVIGLPDERTSNTIAVNLAATKAGTILANLNTLLEIFVEGGDTGGDLLDKLILGVDIAPGLNDFFFCCSVL